MPNRLIIDDDNYRQHLGDGEEVTINGQVRKFGCVRTPGRMRAAPQMTLAAAGVQLIPESEWAARAQQRLDDAADIKSLTYATECLDQDGRGQCWLYGNCGAFRSRCVIQGGVIRLPSVQSLAWAIYGGRSWGNRGGDPADSFEALMDQGAARSQLWPMNGEGQSGKCKTDAAEADRANNHLLVGVELGHENKRWNELVSCLLQGIPCAACWDWWSHHTEVCDYMPSGNLRGRNSWSADYGDNGFYELAGSKKFPSGAWAFVQVTQSI